MQEGKGAQNGQASHIREPGGHRCDDPRADRGELIHHPEAAVRRDPGAPLLTDEQAASLMAQSLANLEKLEERRAEARTARHT